MEKEIKIYVCNMCSRVFNAPEGCHCSILTNYNPHVLTIDGNSLGRVIMKQKGNIIVEEVKRYKDDKSK